MHIAVMNKMTPFSPLFGVVFALSLVLTLSACRKYEDGPSVSFRSKAARITNVWKIQSLSRNNLDETDRYAFMTWNFQEPNTNKIGQLEWSYRMAGDSADIIFPPATWELATLKEQIKLTYAGVIDPIGPVIETRLLYLDIRRLKEDEMWLEYRLDGDDYFVRLSPN